MGRIEKTAFISYRRTDEPWALAIFQNLTQHGYDVFIDYDGIASGKFETVIFENIRARAHFLALLTPTALTRCSDPEDWMRLEIEAALDSHRNIVPLMLAGFDFGTPAIASQLIGRLQVLKEYNGLRIPEGYFSPAMDRLRNKFLNVPVDAVLHSASDSAQQVATEQKSKATRALAANPKHELAPNTAHASREPAEEEHSQRDAEAKRQVEDEQRQQREAQAEKQRAEERRREAEAEAQRIAEERQRQEKAFVTRETERQPGSEHSLTMALRSHSARAVAIGVLCGLLSASCIFVTYPLGIESSLLLDSTVFLDNIGEVAIGIAPTIPALSLGLGIVLVARQVTRITWKSAGLILLLTCLAWEIAWLTVCFSMWLTVSLMSNVIHEPAWAISGSLARSPYVKDFTKIVIGLPSLVIGRTSYVISAGLAGYIGSALLTLGLSSIIHEKGRAERQSLRRISRNSTAFALWGSVAVIFWMISGGEGWLGLSLLLGLFVPWQTWYIASLVTTTLHREVPRTYQVYWLTSSIFFIALLTPIRTPLDKLPYLWIFYPA
jgi:TIR domain